MWTSAWLKTGATYSHLGVTVQGPVHGRRWTLGTFFVWLNAPLFGKLARRQRKTRQRNDVDLARRLGR